MGDTKERNGFRLRIQPDVSIVGIATLLSFLIIGVWQIAIRPTKTDVAELIDAKIETHNRGRHESCQTDLIGLQKAVIELRQALGKVEGKIEVDRVNIVALHHRLQRLQALLDTLWPRSQEKRRKP